MTLEEQERELNEIKAPRECRPGVLAQRSLHAQYRTTPWNGTDDEQVAEEMAVKLLYRETVSDPCMPTMRSGNRKGFGLPNRKPGSRPEMLMDGPDRMHASALVHRLGSMSSAQ